MGAVHVDVTIRNPADRSRSWQRPFLVDTGATDSVVPRECVDAVGLTPEGYRTYELADGRKIQMGLAVARIEFLEDFVGGTVVFGEPGTKPLLGVTVLESMGVEVDPRNGELRKLPAVRLKALIGSHLLTFSQAHGHEPLPKLLQLEEMPREARIRIMNVLTQFVGSCVHPMENWSLLEPLRTISRDLHTNHFVRPLTQWHSTPEHIQDLVEGEIMTQPFFKVFDLVQYILRHPECPRTLIAALTIAFADSQLAYDIDDSGPPTIIPMVTAEEGQATTSSMRQLADDGMEGSASHLRKSSECINRQEWADSIRESIHAVESVARQINPDARQIGVALSSLEERVSLHPALKQAIVKLYGYTSDEQGIRHALLEREAARVGMEEAVFMLGTCAAFASYLWRKHKGAPE